MIIRYLDPQGLLFREAVPFPGAPSSLRKRLLGYVTKRYIESIEPRTHNEQLSPRDWHHLCSKPRSLHHVALGEVLPPRISCYVKAGMHLVDRDCQEHRGPCIDRYNAQFGSACVTRHSS